MKKALYTVIIILLLIPLIILYYFLSSFSLIGGSYQVSSLAYPTCMGVKYFVLVVMLASDGAIIVATG